MPWVADAVFGAGGVANPVQRRGAPTASTAGIGELRNPTFPSEVAAGEPWTGTIDAFNTGTETHTFRFRSDGAEIPVDLAPGASHTHGWSGTGPKEFWIYLDRWVAEEPEPELPWYLIGAAASACVIGVALVFMGKPSKEPSPL
ncbi:hypothetical protein ES703_00048 [subsurface metagenome]